MAIIISSGESSNGIIVENDSLTISNGGTATATTVNDKGEVSVYGTADTTTVNEGGSVFVYQDGVASGTTVNAGGRMYVSEGGKADAATVNPKGAIFVSEGGTALAVTENGGWVQVEDGADVTFLPNSLEGLVLNENDAVTVHSGTTATDATVNYHGTLAIYDGGIVSGVVVNSGGSFGVFSGGAVVQAVENGGFAYDEEEGATVTFLPNSFSGLVLNETATVHSGTTATDITLDSNGALWAYSDGIMSGVTVNAGGRLFISGANVQEVKENGGYVYFSETEGSVVTLVPNAFSGLVLEGTSATVHSGTTATDITLDSNGQIIILSGGILNGATVNSLGGVYVYDKGDAGAVTVNAGGNLRIFSGATAHDTVINSGGWFDLMNGGYASGIEAAAGAGLRLDVAPDTYAQGTYDGSAFEIKDASVSGFTVHSGSELNIYEGGAALNTVVDDKGQVNVSGGAAEGITVNAGGELYVSGGAAHNIVENGGYVRVKEGADVSFVSNTISGLVLTQAAATVHSGTTLDKATIGSEGYLYISGGVANGTVINADGELKVYSGGLADSVAVKANGWLYVFSGGTATNVDWTPCEGAIYTDRGATVTYASMYYGVYYGSGGTLLSSAATMTDITLGAYYEMNVMKNGEATGTIVDNDGEFYIFSGGTASATTVKTGGWTEVSSGAVAVDTVLQADCTLLVLSGGKVTGNLTVEDGADAHFYDGSILDFDLTKITEGVPALVNGLSFIEGAPTYTLTVEGVLADGAYSLASGAAGFDGTILVNKTLGDSLGSLTVGGPSLIRDGKKYTLTLTEANLSVTIAEDESGVDFSGDLTSATVDITSGMVASSVNINTEGHLNVYEGGVASVTTVNFGGDLYVSSGGSALQIKENGGYVNIDDDAAEVTFVANTFSGLTLYGLKRATVHSGTTATDIVVDSRGTLLIFSGGLANNATANANGRVYIYDGGTVNNAVINPDGMLVLSSGGSATGIVASAGASLGLTVAPKTYAQGAYGGSAFELKDAAIADYTVNSGCWLGASAGGVATNAIANDGGQLYAFEGGVFNAPTVDLGGILCLYDEGGSALQIKENGGAVIGEITSNVTFASNTFSGVVVEGWREATVHSGTTATDVTLNAGGMDVYDGGVANTVVVNKYGILSIHEGGAVSDATVNAGGDLHVSSGGAALQIRENGGYVKLIEGANATFVANAISGLVLDDGVSATLHSGTTATEVSLNEGCDLEIYSGGVASAVAVNDEASLSIYDGGIASVVTVNEDGALFVTSGGTVNGVTVNSGAMAEVSSGTISGAVVNAGGNLLIYDGTKITGHMTFESGAEVIPFVGSILDFDLTQTTAGAVALVNDLSILLGTPAYTLTVAGTEAAGVYSLAEGAARFNKSITIVNNATGEELGTLTVGGEAIYVGNISYSLNLADSALTVTVDDTPPPVLPTNLVGTKDKVSWESEVPGPYVLVFSTDNFDHVLEVSTSTTARDILNLPAGTYQWRVEISSRKAWAVGNPIESEQEPANAPKVLQSNGDGNDDLFFATANGTWNKLYLAEHTGSYNDWAGTNEKVFAKGRNQLADLFFGSNDASILCLTDDANGDAIFLDDAFTDLPESITKQQARIAQIDEIRAGAGDDIVDMTSPKFEYVGSGMTIRGGDGSDVIWANKGSNKLFGDAGNDRITGASGNDVIVGGSGNDRMHGGGGNDIFTFCDNWGMDSVQQIETGTVTLWFASGSESNWNAETLTYTDGPDSVTVKGVTADKITLKFGSDASEQYASLAHAGAFDAFTSQKIFEDSGILASV